MAMSLCPSGIPKTLPWLGGSKLNVWRTAVATFPQTAGRS